MFEKDSTVKSYAMTLWANHIETGQVHLSAKDVSNLSRNTLPELSDQQKAFVARLRRMAIEELNNG